MRSFLAAFGQARRGLAQRRRRAVLTALGITLAAAMLSAGVVIADGLGLGFNRAVRVTGLPDLIIRFNGEPVSVVTQRIEALPDVAGFTTRFELTGGTVSAPGHGSAHNAVAEVLGTGGGGRLNHPLGYKVVEGRDVTGDGNEVLVEKAFGDAWGLTPGSVLHVGGLGPERVVGQVEAPDNVGYPLAAPRFYLSINQINRRFGPQRDPRVDLAEVWLRDPRYLSEVLAQARSESYGLKNIRFATRAGIRVLLDQAAGIVIDLLVALSLIALLTAGTLLAASARAEVQRRLGAIGIRRAVGATRGQVVLAQSLEAVLVAAPAAALGVAIGTVAILGPTNRLLTLLNEPAPGRGLILPLAGVWLVSVLLPTLGTAWPAFTAAGGSVIGLMRGAGLGGSRRRRRRRAGVRGVRVSGLAVLGARLASARRVRWFSTVAMLGMSTAFVLLMIALAGALTTLETDPTALGRRYELTAAVPPSAAAQVRRFPGVAAATPRYEVVGADAYALGEAIDVIGYHGNHVRFEAPPLTTGHRIHGAHQAEVGMGLANALGLVVGAPFAVALPNGSELRLTVAGIVSSLDYDGRVAYVPAAALLRVDPDVASTLVVITHTPAQIGPVYSRLVQLSRQFGAGAAPQHAAGATARGVPLVDVLRTILRAVAIVDGLVCLYALIQACTLTVQERRRAIAVLRACGAGGRAVRRLLLGAALTLVVPAAAAGVLLERFVLGPALSHLAINYAVLQLDPTRLQVGAVLAGLGALALLAVIWVSAQALRSTVVSGLSR